MISIINFHGKIYIVLDCLFFIKIRFAIFSTLHVTNLGSFISWVILVSTKPGKTDKTFTFDLCNLFLRPDKKAVNPDLADP